MRANGSPVGGGPCVSVRGAGFHKVSPCIKLAKASRRGETLPHPTACYLFDNIMALM